MAILDPQQELFTEARTMLAEQFDVYDGALPPDGTPYPFIYLADTQQVDDLSNKSAVMADIYLTVHLWGDDVEKRGTFSGILLDVKNIVRSITQSAHYSFTLRGCDQRILNDNTTSTPLLHGVLEFHFILH